MIDLEQHLEVTKAATAASEMSTLENACFEEKAFVPRKKQLE